MFNKLKHTAKSDDEKLFNNILSAVFNNKKIE